MIRTLLCGLIAAATVCGTNLARAQDAEKDYARAGCYLGFAGTVAVDTGSEDAFQEAGLSADLGRSLGLNTRLGCRLIERLGGEVQFEWLDGSNLSVAGRDEYLKPWSVTANFKLYALTGRIQPFGAFGVGYLDFLEGSSSDIEEIDDWGWDFIVRMGGGLDFYVTENIVLDIDMIYVRLLDGKYNGAGYLSMGWGVLYRF